MFKTWLRWGLSLWGVILCGVLLGSPVLGATEIKDPLLRILVRKGILTPEEALEIKREAEREIATQTASESSHRAWHRGFKIGTKTYLDYSLGYGPFDQGDSQGKNYFAVTRAYLDIRKKINSWLSFRFTPDIHGGNTGDYDLRIKYLYAQFRLPDLGFLTHLKGEFGQGHMPWLDFEEHINPYRMQGTMAREFFGTFNSADRGVSLAGYLGGRLEGDYLRRLIQHYPLFDHYAGRYGSFWLSYLNGPGYHSAEVNPGKALEGRITLRPFGRHTAGAFPLAGLQLSYFFIRGKGNLKDEAHPFRLPEYPDYQVDLFMLSYQHPWFVFYVQYSTSRGNSAGTWVVDTNGDGRGDKELETEAWSLFADVTLPLAGEKLHLFGRYDLFDPNDDLSYWDGARWISSRNDRAEHYILGLAYYFTGKNILMLAMEGMHYQNNFRLSTDQFAKWGRYEPGGFLGLEDGFRVQTVLQVIF